MFDKEALRIGILLNKDKPFDKIIKGPTRENKDEVLLP